MLEPRGDIHMRIIGWVGNAELLCPGCAEAQGFAGEEGTPIFAIDAHEGDYCGQCLNMWILGTEPEERKGGAPDWVYLEDCQPTKRESEG